jgi:dethiobiotin synthetase
MSVLFVTATGTEIGKTFVTSLLTRQLRTAGRDPLALKPVISDFTDARAAQSDTGHLLQAMGRPVTPDAVAQISPWRFEAALSPDMAASREGRALDYSEILGWCRAEIDRHKGPTLVEGVGGAMVPLGPDKLVTDWIQDLGCPVLLVAGAYLGTISHTLTTLSALRTRGIPVRGLVLSEKEPGPVPLAETAGAIGRFAQGLPIALVQQGADAATAPDLAALSGL